MASETPAGDRVRNSRTGDENIHVDDDAKSPRPWYYLTSPGQENSVEMNVDRD